jgi:glycosidase
MKFFRIFTLLFILIALVACQSGPVAMQPITGLPQGSDNLPWWNDSVFYEIFVRSFYDSNGDGIGDFNGITQKLDYLNDGDPKTTTDLGVTALWLMPINPSPSYHGYDVTDYFAVNPAYGTLDDFKNLLKEAHKRGIRVIIDMVMNHTSNRHPWFEAAKDPASPYHNWYIWSDTNPNYSGPWNEAVWYPVSANQFYYAIFTSEMPDLNYNNPEVVAKMQEVGRFWLKDVGVDGFRLDAARHIVEEGRNQADTTGTHAWWKTFRPAYKGANPQAMTVGEIWTTNADVAPYVAQGDQLDLAFDFDLASAMVQSAKARSTWGITSALANSVSLFPAGQNATFLTNHDMDRVMTQLGQDPDKAKLAAALLLTTPGVPFIYYGEEIGMTGAKPDENIRTPMQWTADSQTGGFTTKLPWEGLSVDTSKWNVAGQTTDKTSLLSAYRTLINLRNQHVALRVGEYVPVQADASALLAFLRVSKAETVLVLINLSPEAVSGYSLSLGSSSLTGKYNAVPLLGEGSFAAPTLTPQGGFSAYQPLPTVPANGVVIVQLQK